MTPTEAAARLNVPESHITAIREHSAGHIVSLRKGPVMLVAETVARAYIPEVDDVVPVPVPRKPATKRAAPKQRGA